LASPRDEHDLLLKAPSLVETELAQQLLEEAGIPSLLHPVDSHETFALNRYPFEAPDLYVPKGMRERAEAVLRAAWSDRAQASPESPAASDEERG
jgi:hypothetical protein